MIDDKRDQLKEEIKRAITKSCREYYPGSDVSIDALLCLTFRDDNDCQEVYIKICDKLNNIVNKSSKAPKTFDNYILYEDKYINIPGKEKVKYENFDECGVETSQPQTSTLTNQESIDVNDDKSNNVTDTRGCDEEMIPKRRCDEQCISLQEQDYFILSSIKQESETPHSLSGQNSFICSHCKTCYSSFREMEVHKFCVHKTFTCCHCNKEFSSNQNQQEHTCAHPGSRPYSCTTCKHSFSRKNHFINRISNNSKNMSLLCTICFKMNSDRNSLRSHIKKSHNSRLASLCVHCSRGFVCDVSAERQEIVHYDRQSKHNPSFDSAISENIDNVSSYSCPTCKIPTDNEGISRIHLSSDSENSNKIICPLCGGNFYKVDEFAKHSCFTSEDINPHLNKDTHELLLENNQNNQQTPIYAEENFAKKCENTDVKSFPSYENFKDIDHDDFNDKVTKIPVIDLCSISKFKITDSKNTNSNNHLISTQASTLDKAIDLSFGGCNNTVRCRDISNNCEINHHIKSDLLVRNINYKTNSVSSRIKPDLLSSVNYSFKKTTKTYERSSNSTKTKQNSANQHEDQLVENDRASILRLNEDVKAKKFKSNQKIGIKLSCDCCNDVFNDFSKYSDHLLHEHRRYACDHCPMSFTAKPNRDRHRRYHTGERPYSCQYCPRAFYRGDDLKYHRTVKHLNKVTKK